MHVCMLQFHECVYNTNFRMCVYYNLMDVCIFQLHGCLCNTTWWMGVRYNSMDVSITQLDVCMMQRDERVYNTNFMDVCVNTLMDGCITQPHECVYATTWWVCVQYNFMDVCWCVPFAICLPGPVVQHIANRLAHNLEIISKTFQISTRRTRIFAGFLWWKTIVFLWIGYLSSTVIFRVITY